MTAAAAIKPAPPPAFPKPTEEPLIVDSASFDGSIGLVDYDGRGLQTTDTLRRAKGWTIEYYPKAGVFRIYNARAATRMPVQVTTVFRDRALYVQFAEDTEGRE